MGFAEENETAATDPQAPGADFSPTGQVTPEPAGHCASAEEFAAKANASMAAAGQSHAVNNAENPASNNVETSDGDAPGEAAASAGDPMADLAAAQEARIGELTEQLARSNAAYYNLDQEYANFVRRSKAEAPQHRAAGIGEVIEALMSVLDDIALARQHGDLQGSFAAVAQKLESTLETKFGLHRFGKVGQAFDPQLHLAIQSLEGDDSGEHVITQIAQPGYLQGSKVLRPAMVIVGCGEVTEPPTSLTATDRGEADAGGA